MYDLPYNVTRKILEYHKLPDSLVKIIYLLMEREVKENYPAVRISETIDDPEPLLIPYVQAFDYVLQKLPPIYEKGAGTFDAPIRAIAHELPFTRYSFYNKTFSAYTVPKKDFLKYPSYPPQFLADFLEYQVGFNLEPRHRFQHTHILASTGAGKTQLIQQLLLRDFETEASVIVLAPKGTLIPNILNLAQLDHERLVIIRPEDPISLNIFDIGATDTESQTNNAVGLINYIFSSILDAGTTGKQTALLNYCIRLCLKIPKANLLTLRTLLKQDSLPLEYVQYVSALPRSGQEFFNEGFARKGEEGYTKTKREMLWRIDLLLENTLVDKIFAQPETRLNIREEIERGKIILIDSSIKHLGEFGSSFLGRFFIALVSLASQQRDTSKDLRPVWFYIDEASTYLSDGMLESILERARESKVGLTLAHQQLSQLSRISPQLEASVLSNTLTKFVGQCSHADGATMGKEMDVEADTLKHQKPLHFMLSIKGVQKPLQIVARAGKMESYQKRTEGELNHVLRENRAKYSVPEKKVETPKNTPSPAEDSSDDEFASFRKP